MCARSHQPYILHSTRWIFSNLRFRHHFEFFFSSFLWAGSSRSPFGRAIQHDGRICILFARFVKHEGKRRKSKNLTMEHFPRIFHPWKLFLASVCMVTESRQCCDVKIVLIIFLILDPALLCLFRSHHETRIFVHAWFRQWAWIYSRDKNYLELDHAILIDTQQNNLIYRIAQHQTYHDINVSTWQRITYQNWFRDMQWYNLEFRYAIFEIIDSCVNKVSSKSSNDPL